MKKLLALCVCAVVCIGIAVAILMSDGEAAKSTAVAVAAPGSVAAFGSVAAPGLFESLVNHAEDGALQDLDVFGDRVEGRDMPGARNPQGTGGAGMRLSAPGIFFLIL